MNALVFKSLATLLAGAGKTAAGAANRIRVAASWRTLGSGKRIRVPAHWRNANRAPPVTVVFNRDKTTIYEIGARHRHAVMSVEHNKYDYPKSVFEITWDSNLSPRAPPKWRRAHAIDLRRNLTKALEYELKTNGRKRYAFSSDGEVRTKLYDRLAPLFKKYGYAEQPTFPGGTIRIWERGR